MNYPKQTMANLSNGDVLEDRGRRQRKEGKGPVPPWVFYIQSSPLRVNGDSAGTLGVSLPQSI